MEKITNVKADNSPTVKHRKKSEYSADNKIFFSRNAEYEKVV